MNSRVCISCGTLFDGFNVTCNICLASEKQQKTANANSRLQLESNERVERERLAFEQQQAHDNHMRELAHMQMMRQQNNPQPTYNSTQTIKPSIDLRSPEQKAYDDARWDALTKQWQQEAEEKERNKKLYMAMGLAIASLCFWFLIDYWVWILAGAIFTVWANAVST